MSLESALKLDASLFDPKSITEETNAYNAQVLKLTQQPGWWEVGAEKYRKMRKNGETALPAPIILEQGINTTIPSREAGRSIPCRVFYPPDQYPSAEKPKPEVKGIVMHIHGGGWVLFDEQSADTLLQFYATASGCVVISVGYRLAPEHPFPAAPEDCADVADFLVKNGNEKFGSKLTFIGGESAGGHLSLLTTFHLLRTYPDFTLPGGLLLHFPATDLSFPPSVYNIPDAPVLTYQHMERFIGAFLPGMSDVDRKSPKVSPLYEDLEKFRLPKGSRLPKALFTCGTIDPLIDDSLFMSVRWQAAGGEAVLRIYNGAVHGFLGFGVGEYEPTGNVLMDTNQFIEEAMEALERTKHKL